jgi:O-antigen/teichoic acid export membrane protein
MSAVQRIFRNVFSNWATLAITAIVSFSLTPFVINSLGPEQYGIWILALSLTGHLGILDMGLRPMIVKFVSQFQAVDDDHRTNEVLNTAFVMLSLLGLVVFAGSTCIAYFADQWFVVAKDYMSELRLTIFLVGINLSLSFMFGAFSTIYYAFQRFHLANKITISIFLVRSVLIVLALLNGGGLVHMAGIVLAASIVEKCIKLAVCYRIYPALTINPRLARRRSARTLAKFGGLSFIIQVSNRISFQTDPIVLATFISTAAITPFAIGAVLVEYMAQLISLIAVTITPVASALHAKDNMATIRKLFITGTRYTLLIILPIALTLIIAGDVFINIWMGPEYTEQSYSVLVILTIGFIGYMSQKIGLSILFGMVKVKLVSLVSLACAALNVVLSVLLAPSMGINGVAIGTAIPLIIYGTIFLPFYTCGVLNIRTIDYVTGVLVRPLLASLAFIASLCVSVTWFDIDTLPLFLLHVTAACTVYGAVAFFIALEPAHRELIMTKMRTFLARVPA